RTLRRAGSRGPPLEHRPAGGVAAHVGDLRSRGEAHHRQGTAGLPRGARISCGEHMNARVEKLLQKLEEPLIVTTPANVRYLTGFVSSNVSLVVEPDRVRLFTDFRYATAAHADPSDQVIESGTTIVVDAGAALDGYCSDCTRTFATGELPDELRRAYDVCLEAQLKGVEAARSGIEAKVADAAARGVIEQAGFGENFGHGLGHGVGIDVHEAPRVAATSTDSLVTNNVVTIEPGIYLEDTGGIRIEDLVIVTDGEAEVLSNFP